MYLTGNSVIYRVKLNKTCKSFDLYISILSEKSFLYIGIHLATNSWQWCEWKVGGIKDSFKKKFELKRIIYSGKYTFSYFMPVLKYTFKY